MIFALRFYRDAEVDLQRLSEYIREEFGPRVAENQIDRLLRKIQMLGNFPYMGQLFPTTAAKPENISRYYWLRGPKNSIFYEIVEEKQLILVLRVLDNHQDIVQQIQKFVLNREHA